MKRPQLYLETSVWNYYFADDAPEKKEITLRFFDKVRQGEYEIFISDIVIEEIGRADDSKKRSLLNIIAEYSPTRLKKLRSLHNSIFQKERCLHPKLRMLCMLRLQQFLR
mgnify:CR=1 FL=1